MTVRPDPTFHATARLAMEAPAEKIAYVLMLSPDFSQPDGLAVVDVDPGAKNYGKVVHKVIMPNKGDEFHHFGWNACSSATGQSFGHLAPRLLRALRARQFKPQPPLGYGRAGADFDQKGCQACGTQRFEVLCVQCCS